MLAMLTSLTCTVLLFREYAARRIRLLLWSALCFVGLSLNSIVLVADLVIFPHVDMRLARLLASLVGLMFLLYGFIWEAES
jgi:hypothetical protein